MKKKYVYDYFSFDVYLFGSKLMNVVEHVVRHSKLQLNVKALQEQKIVLKCFTMFMDFVNRN